MVIRERPRLILVLLDSSGQNRGLSPNVSPDAAKLRRLLRCYVFFAVGVFNDSRTKVFRTVQQGF